MRSILSQVTDIVAAALKQAFGDDAQGVDPFVRASGDPKFGDYQSNVAMGLGKKLGAKPRDVARRIVDALPERACSMFDPPEIAGPGFINLRLNRAFLESALGSIPPAPASAADDRLGIDPVDAAERETVVVDYSSPNVAKQMHVGHLRSTIIGDTIARVLAFCGHKVIRQNHLGDWGTQFGMVILGLWHIAMAQKRGEKPGYVRRAFEALRRAQSAGTDGLNAHLKTLADQADADLRDDPDGARLFEPFLERCERESVLSLDDVEAAYIYINRLREAAQGTPFEPRLADPKSIAVMMQRGDRPERRAREVAIAVTLRECNEIYRRLGVQLTDDDVCGESFYEPLLPGVVEEVRAALATKEGQTGPIRAVCREDQGAICVFFEKPDGSPAFKGPQGDSLPMIVRKSDGATLYATTDLAGVLYRTAHVERHPIRLHSRALREALGAVGGGLGAGRAIYVVGAPQKLHFEMLFAAIAALGWARRPGGRDVRLEHVAFGSVLGGDRKMLRTRSGDSVKLRDLLDEAVQRAEAQVRQSEADLAKRRGFSEDETRRIAETVGIAAVKYADLCQNRNTDYVFSWDKMLALQGNTAPYMLYAYARVRSIQRKGEETGRLKVDVSSAAIALGHDTERSLALAILRLAETIESVGESLLPNVLCDYLYDLAGRFMAFYESCPVLQAEDDATLASRLRLCDLTARALHVGLGLLGIPTLERM